jgi:hypothetical protein
MQERMPIKRHEEEFHPEQDQHRTFEGSEIRKRSMLKGLRMLSLCFEDWTSYSMKDCSQGNEFADTQIGCAMSDSAASILMCPPTYFDVQYVINPWMEGNIGKVRSSKARKQWDDLYWILSNRSGVSIVEPVPHRPDMCFVANAESQSAQ